MDLTAGLVFLWIGFGVTSAVIASAYGRDFILWLVLGVVFGLFALIAVIALPKPESAVKGGPTGKAGDRECPECHGWTIDWARKCKHCGHAFSEKPIGAPAE